MTVQHKNGPSYDADRAAIDRLRQRAGKRKRIAETAERVLKEYKEGRAASACMADLRDAVEK